MLQVKLGFMSKVIKNNTFAIIFLLMAIIAIPVKIAMPDYTGLLLAIEIGSIIMFFLTRRY